ncbi:MAG: hypothetical protein ACKV2T_17250 [Kofleriaceae bacterium]
MKRNLLVHIALAIGAALGACKTAPVANLGPVQGRPVVTLELEVPESNLEAVLANLVRCTAQVFGPFNEDPSNPSSPAFSIRCHVTQTYRDGLDFNCTTQPNNSSCSLNALYDERIESTCKTPGGRAIWFRVGP